MLLHDQGPRIFLARGPLAGGAQGPNAGKDGSVRERGPYVRESEQSDVNVIYCTRALQSL